MRQLGQAGLAKEGSLGPQFRNTNTVPFWGPRGERFCIWIVGGHSWVQDTGPPWLWPRILAVSLPYLHSHSHKSSSEPTTFFISPCKPGLCDPGPLPWSEMGNYETLCVQHLIFISSLLKIFLRWKQDTVYTYVCGSKIKILIDSLEGVACFWPHFKCQFTRKWKVLVTSVMSDSLRPRGLESARLLSHWNYSGKNIGVGCHALLQGGSSQPRDWTQVSHTAGRFFTIWAIREANLQKQEEIFGRWLFIPQLYGSFKNVHRGWKSPWKSMLLQIKVKVLDSELHVNSASITD